MNNFNPLVIVFCGVNGVGKSTNMAKIAYRFKMKAQLKVMIAACDTFRAGAIEQVKKHAKVLEINVFDKGYGKEPADVCKEAVNVAKRDKIDVVLVDTAGRMQDDIPLMTALNKLVYNNNPNYVLFVGEALVGNDSIDQLKKFNNYLMEHPLNNKQPRGIDAIVLSKFDTVDDKVGACISMVYSTNKPIV